MYHFSLRTPSTTSWSGSRFWRRVFRYRFSCSPKIRRATSNRAAEQPPPFRPLMPWLSWCVAGQIIRSRFIIYLFCTSMMIPAHTRYMTTPARADVQTNRRKRSFRRPTTPSDDVDFTFFTPSAVRILVLPVVAKIPPSLAFCSLSSADTYGPNPLSISLSQLKQA